jgi:hypothetical protein
MDASDDNVVNELAALLPVPSALDLPISRQLTLREHLMTEIRQAAAEPITAGPQRWRARPRGLIVAIAGAAVAVVAAVAVAVSALGGPGSGGSGPGASGPGASGAVLLARVARAAAGQTSPAVHDDQYMYIATEGASEATIVGPNGSVTTRMDPLSKAQIWISVSNLCRPGLLRTDGQDTKLTDNPGAACPDRGSLNNPTYRLLQSLPTNPHTLLNMIYTVEKGHGQTPDQEAFTTIGDLLRESIAPPQVSAALYRAAALIPGVTAVPDVENATGAHGVGVAFGRETWVFDKTTLAMIGERDVDAAGKVTGESAILARGFVDRPGQLP